MKKILYILIAASLLVVNACQLQEDSIEKIGSGPSDGSISVDATDPYNPVFTATAQNGFIYQWNLDNSQTKTGETVTSYYPFSGDYTIECTISGEGGKGVTVTKTYNIATTDPAIADLPYWKELTGGGAGKTWVYNTDPATGFPDYSFQTYWDLEAYPEHWKPQNSWGQCVRFTPDLGGEMVFDLSGGINYTYHQVANNTGIKGTFALDTENMTLKVVNPYILDYAIDCTTPSVTVLGTYDIKLLNDDEMVLWQHQENGTGWSWSFKRKGS